MAVIKLTEIPSFENNFKSLNITNRINALGSAHLYKNSKYNPVLLVSDQKNTSLILLEEDGGLYDSSQSKEIKKLKSFKDLNIQAINGNTDYSPELAWIDTGCIDRSYVVDTNLNMNNNTQHIAKYDRGYSNSAKKNSFTLDDVIVQIDNQHICHFAISESRSYDTSYGGYPLTFYIINEKGVVFEFDTQNYRNKIFANPQSLIWKPTSFIQKGGFVKLIENPHYWGNKEDLIYAFGLDTNSGNSFSLELVNMSSLQPGNPHTRYTSNHQNRIKLDFGNNINFSQGPLPKFDSACCLDDKEFLIAMTPIVNGTLDMSCRDIYWFRLKSNKDEAILLADPHRIQNIDRFDPRGTYNSMCIKHIKDISSLEEAVYLITGQNKIMKFRLDLKP